jgi:hypothetical protein
LATRKNTKSSTFLRFNLQERELSRRFAATCTARLR